MSAYINKALQADGLYVRRFHMPCRWVTTAEAFANFTLTFKQFVQCLLYNARSNGRKALQGDLTIPLNLSSRGAGMYLDQHWAPQVHLSRPCDTNYTLIGHHEHFVEDFSATINILKYNVTVKKANSSPNSLKRSLSYWYRQLDMSMISDLQQLYKLDFKVFGFNSTPPI